VALPMAWFNLRSDLETALRSKSRADTVSRTGQYLRHGFVAQIALSVVLLAGAALLGLSLKNVMAVSPGFRADHVIAGEFTLPYARFPAGRTNASVCSIACSGQSPKNRESLRQERLQTFRSAATLRRPRSGPRRTCRRPAGRFTLTMPMA
jgi:hypothetical protein